MKLIIIRHGDPNYVLDTLTEKGWREAELLSRRISKMKVDYFYCSPLGRARDTASLTLKAMNRTAETLDWLEEFPGYIVDPQQKDKRIPWDLMPSYWTREAQLYGKDSWLDFPLMRTGNVPEMFERAMNGLEALLEKHGYRYNDGYYKAEKPNTDTVVLFCHFGIECVILSRLLGISPLVLWQSFVALPTSVTTVVTEEREKGIAYFRCNGFGDVSHLYAGDEEPSFSARFCEIFDSDERH